MQQPRVLEIGGGVAASYAAKLLADHGADVVKVEPPQGDALRRWGPFPDHQPDPEQSGLFIALNVNKRSTCFDLQHDAEELHRWLQWADILVSGLHPTAARDLHLDAASLRATYPGLVTLAITPFGSSGPYADFQATELILSNAGGWANLCPNTHTDPNLPPLKVYGDQCQLMAAIAGAASVLATWHYSATDDEPRSGQRVGEYIDLSVQSYVASVLEAALPVYTYRGEVGTRNHLRSLIPWRIFHAQDGLVFLVCVEQDQWERLVEFMGNPEWAQLEVFADQAARAENQDLVHMYVQEFVSQWRAEDLYHAAQKERICVAPILNLDQISQNEHLIARSFFQTLKQPGLGEIPLLGSAILVDGQRAGISRPAPAVGAHLSPPVAAVPANRRTVETTAQAHAAKPLSGVRILDLTWVWAGPYGTMNLAHLGAEVIHVESAKRPDLYRRLPVFPPGLEGLNKSGMFNQWNQGKLSLSVDLQSPQGIELIKQLIPHCDAVVQNFATGALQRLGLSFDALKTLNPQIILASVSGYGQQGPYADYMGYGPAMPGLTGLSASTGYLGGEAEEFGLSMPDPTAGITTTWAVVSALHRRDAQGAAAVAQHLDISMWEATAVLNAEGWMHHVLHQTTPQPMGNRSANMSPHGVFRCLDSPAGEPRWVAIACRDNAEWQKLAQLAELDLTNLTTAELADRKACEDALEAALGRWTAEQEPWAVAYALQAQGIPAFPTLSTREVADDPHLNARGFIERLAHPEVGARAHAGIPWLFTSRPNGVARPAPCLGADTDHVLQTVLGYDEEQLQALRNAGVIDV